MLLSYDCTVALSGEGDCEWLILRVNLHSSVEVNLVGLWKMFLCLRVWIFNLKLVALEIFHLRHL